MARVSVDMIRISKCSALLAACLGLAIATGCQRGEPPKPTGRPSSQPMAEPEKEKPKAEAAPATGLAVLEHMAAAYRKASSYADAGTVRLLAEAGGQKIVDQTSPFSVALSRPNKLQLLAYQMMLVCDGQTIHAAIENIPNQVLVKQAPLAIDLKLFRIDPNLAMSIGDFAGPPPQLMLLLSDDPMMALLRDAKEPELIESGQIDGRDCYRVRVRRPDGPVVFWIDQQTWVLRRMTLPTDTLRGNLPQDRPIDKLSLVADFPGARFDCKIDSKAFEFDMPGSAEVVKLLVPPHLGQLLGKPVPDFKFHDLDGKPVVPESLAGKTVVLDFWATWCGPCKLTMPELEKVYQRYKDDPKVAFYAVSVDRPEVENSELIKTFQDMEVNVPILRDTDQSAAALKVSEFPTMLIVDGKGTVQYYDVDNRKIAEELPRNLEKVLAGENIYEPLLKQYWEQLELLKQYAKMLEASVDDRPGAGSETIIREEKLPEVKTAERTEPTTFKITPLWKCADLKSPGNIVVVGGKTAPARLLVVESWKSVAEVGLDGKLIAMHQLDLAEKEIVGNLRTAAGADGRRYVVAFLTTQQRCHVLDENWKLVAHYPADALQNPHGGIADVELGDLDSDGELKLYVSYWGVVGVQAASLDGQRLWANRSLSNVACLAIGGAEAAESRELFCTNNIGVIVKLDAQGQRRGEINVRNRIFHRIAAADLRGDGRPLWCGMAAVKLGNNVAVGFSLEGEELWSHALPEGIQQQPVEPIVPGKITRDGAGQWLLPGPDGSIHVVSADGKLLDRFNYGAVLQGLATVQIDGRPALVVATADGLEAWRVEEAIAK